jgi:hypothetical protein
LIDWLEIMPTDPVAGIRSKIERTQKHVADLEAGVRAFIDSRPYRIASNRDAETGRLIYRMTQVDAVPGEVTQITGDAIAGMASTLDHLAYRIWLNGGGVGTGRHVYFPIGSDATTFAEYEAERKRKVKGLPTHVVAAMDALEPYKGGKGNQLWVLNELNNLAKHRDIIAVGSQFRSMNIAGLMTAQFLKIGTQVEVPDLFLRPAHTLCPLKAGDVVFVDNVNAEPNSQIEFRFDVALSEPQITDPQPLIETVHQLSGLVSRVVDQFSEYL